MGRISVFVGDVFDRLTVIEDLGVFNKNRKVLCLCECGNTLKVFTNNLKKGNTKSCGCYATDALNMKWDEIYVERGFGKKGQITPEYLAWRNMKSRCYNPKDISYPNYGAVGVTVCDEWLSCFENFLSDVGIRPSNNHSLDRNDVNGNYCKSNVSWKDQFWQTRNKGKVTDCSSKYKGVCFENNRWRARIKDSNGEAVQLGYFNDERSAALAVDMFLKQEYGEDCPWTNRNLGLLQEEEDNG